MILTDEFIYTQLAEEEQFQENGRFSKARFESFARSNGFIPSDYLKRVREDFLISIWRQSIINSSFITDLDVSESMALADQERDITFIKLSAERFKNSVSYQEEDLQNYYLENKSAYMSPDRAKVSYVSLDSEELQSTVKVSEEEILKRSEDIIKQGVSGIVYGRNVIQHDNPAGITRALMAVVHDGLSAKEALNLIN